MFALLVVLLVISTQGASSLKLKDFSVPAVVMRGDPVWLNCSYDLERDKLYSIKWHKNNVEFYRYLPADTPPGQKYELAGIYLDLSRSSEGNIFMSKTDVDSEGTYRCEVSTESSFQTVKGEGEMRIYVNPSSSPVIQGTKHHYAIGETVNASCISAPSRPAAVLKWRINEEEAKKEYLVGPIKEESPDGLFTSTLILTFKVTSSHFWGGRLKLICEAIISQAHTLRSKEILVSNNSNYTIPQRTFSDYDTHNDSPRIRGERSRYDIGDMVDIKCTASKSQPPAELHWYINDKEAKPEFLVPQESIFHRDGTVSTVLGLQFMVRHRHFQKNEMRLRCTATLSEVMRMTSEPLVAEISEQQMSDLHVDVNAGAVSSGCLQSDEVRQIYDAVNDKNEDSSWSSMYNRNSERMSLDSLEECVQQLKISLIGA